VTCARDTSTRQLQIKPGQTKRRPHRGRLEIEADRKAALEPELRSQGDPQVVIGAVVEVNFVADFSAEA
jgi:hypothetical protein